MREPDFWWRPPSWFSSLLAPAAAIYGVVARARMLRPGADAGVPVICVGNFNLGGVGKTPTVIALAEILREANETPFVLSRGYGGRLSGPLRVDPAIHTAQDVGDEPLLSRAAPVIVSRDRVRGAQMAREVGASVIVMDDGFQNPSLRKDFSLIVIDGRRGVGNACVFPAGPLRAPLASQVPRADALIVVGEGTQADGVAAMVASRGRPVLRAAIAADRKTVSELAGTSVLAFAGIGDPERYFTTLRKNGIDVAATRVFSDHHPFTPREIADLLSEAKRRSLVPLTTEKDFMRLRGVAGVDLAAIRPFPVRLAVQDEESWRALILTRIAAAKTN
ncbi:MAG: tetraacyldisaccharide 4'-kinase [Xanthobacteraceae bacterium]